MTNPATFSRDDLRKALAVLPLERGDVVFSHSNIGFFGRPDGVAPGPEICALFAEAILDRLGPNGTLVVPTFTYSFPRQERFNPAFSVCRMGVFAEWVRSHADSARSIDPCYSVAAIGAKAVRITENAPENSFGVGSFFDRFHRHGGKVLNLNFDAGSTFVHYVERCLGVPYRFDKTFTGTLVLDGRERTIRNTIWVRYLSDDALVAAFEPFDALAREKGMFRSEPLGRGAVGVISAADTYNLIERTLPSRPWFLTRAEALGITAPHIVPEAL